MCVRVCLYVKSDTHNHACVHYEYLRVVSQGSYWMGGRKEGKYNIWSNISVTCCKCMCMCVCKLSVKHTAKMIV